MRIFCNLPRNLQYTGRGYCPVGRGDCLRNDRSQNLAQDGYRNSIWILLDYGDVMVHVFREDARNFYSLEGLWSDAKMTYMEDEN